MLHLSGSVSGQRKPLKHTTFPVGRKYKKMILENLGFTGNSRVIFCSQLERPACRACSKQSKALVHDDDALHSHYFLALRLPAVIGHI